MCVGAVEMIQSFQLFSFSCLLVEKKYAAHTRLWQYVFFFSKPAEKQTKIFISRENCKFYTAMRASENENRSTTKSSFLFKKKILQIHPAFSIHLFFFTLTRLCWKKNEIILFQFDFIRFLLPWSMISLIFIAFFFILSFVVSETCCSAEIKEWIFHVVTEFVLIGILWIQTGFFGTVSFTGFCLMWIILRILYY